MRNSPPAQEPRGQTREKGEISVEVENLVVQFGDRKVLDGISLQVKRGELVAIMGSSGGGKSTLLRSIAGLQLPTSGTVRVDGIEVAKDPDLARGKMGMVFQSAALFDSLTVADNVLFGFRRHRHPGHGSAARESEATVLKESLTRVGLEGTEARMPSELSGGMRKRLGLARALALDPQIVLYDEPTTGLDPVTTYQIDTVIADVKNEGVTSIVVSHDLQSVRRIADRVAFLHKGHLIFEGSADEFVASELEPIRELVDKTEATRFL